MDASYNRQNSLTYSEKYNWQKKHSENKTDQKMRINLLRSKKMKRTRSMKLGNSIIKIFLFIFFSSLCFLFTRKIK